MVVGPRSRCQHVRTTVLKLQTRVREGKGDRICPLWLKGEQIKFWRSKIKVTELSWATWIGATEYGPAQYHMNALRDFLSNYAQTYIWTWVWFFFFWEVRGCCDFTYCVITTIKTLAHLYSHRPQYMTRMGILPPGGNFSSSFIIYPKAELWVRSRWLVASLFSRVAPR